MKPNKKAAWTMAGAVAVESLGMVLHKPHVEDQSEYVEIRREPVAIPPAGEHAPHGEGPQTYRANYTAVASGVGFWGYHSLPQYPFPNARAAHLMSQGSTFVFVDDDTDKA